MRDGKSNMCINSCEWVVARGSEPSQADHVQRQGRSELNDC